MINFSSKFKRGLSLAVAVVMVVLILSAAVVSMVSADRETDLKNQQKNLSGDKANIRSEIDGLETQKKTVMEEKKALDDQVTVLEDEISELDVKIDEYEVQIEEVTVELDAATVALEEQYEMYKTRVRVMYESGATGYLDILLSADSVGDFFEKLDIVSQIAEYDSKLTDKLRDEQERIQSKKDELEELKQGLVDSKTSLQTKKSDLDKKMAQRDAIIKKINSSKASLEKQLKEIEAEEARVRAQIARLSKGGTQYTGGAMLWPTPSCRTITSSYGWRMHPVLHYEKLHTGIDIGAGYGAKIIAAESGTVITATYNTAYGNYVVLDHGGGVCTLYAHQSSMAVSVGQYVNVGDTIGYVGSTGYSTGPHLHFEVIVNGATTDPLGYIS